MRQANVILFINKPPLLQAMLLSVLLIGLLQDSEPFNQGKFIPIKNKMLINIINASVLIYIIFKWMGLKFKLLYHNCIVAYFLQINPAIDCK